MLDTDIHTQEKGRNASCRAQSTLIQVDQVFDDFQNDTVGQIKSSLARINDDCEQKLKDIEEEEKELKKKHASRNFKRFSDADKYNYKHL